MTLKIKKETMLSVLGFVLAAYVATFIGKFIGLFGGAELSFLTPFVGCFIGVACRYFFKASIKKIKQMENEIILRSYKSKLEEISKQERLNEELKKKLNEQQNLANGLERELRELEEMKKDLLERFPNALLHKEKTALDLDENDPSYIHEKEPIHKNHSIIKNELKNKSVVNMYLLKEKKSLLGSKFIAAALIAIATFSIFLFNMPYIAYLPGGLLYIILELKDKVLTYRVDKGYFGTSASEALQLIKFIHKNIDEINSNGGGGQPKILNDVPPEEIKTVLLPGQTQHG